MAYSEKLADRIRHALTKVPDVEEKKMFGGLAFMVRGKMCLTAGDGRIMCRINPELHEMVTKKEGTRTVVMRKREYKGWVYVDEDFIQTEDDFNYWVNLALEFNENIELPDKR